MLHNHVGISIFTFPDFDYNIVQAEKTLNKRTYSTAHLWLSLLISHEPGSTGMIPRPHRKPAWSSLRDAYPRVSESIGSPMNEDTKF